MMKKRISVLLIIALILAQLPFASVNAYADAAQTTDKMEEAATAEVESTDVSDSEAGRQDVKNDIEQTENIISDDSVSEDSVSTDHTKESGVSEDVISDNPVYADSASVNTVSGDGNPVKELEWIPVSERIINIEKKGSEEEAVAVLPDKWGATLDDGTETKVDVTWKCIDDFSDDSYTSFVFRGSIDNETSASLTDDEIAGTLLMEIYFEDQIKTGDTGEDGELPTAFSVMSPNTLTGEIEEEQGTGEYTEEFKADYGDSMDNVADADVPYNAAKIMLSKSTYNTFKKISAKSSNYSYKKLSSAEKAFYNRINKWVTQYLYYGKKATKYGGQPLTAYIPTGSLSYTQAGNVYLIYYLNNPQAFFLTTSWYYGSSSGKRALAFCFLPGADTPSEIKSRANEIAKNMNSMANSVKKASGQYNRAKKAQNLVCKRVMYDYQAYYYGNSTNWKDWKAGNMYFDQSLISTFTGSYKKTVCAGYSQGFTAITRLIGMESASISGSGHQWNKVYVDGRWYCIDTTWDDNDSAAGCAYDYFLKSDSYMNTYNYNYGHNWYSYWTGKAPKSSRNYSPSLARYTIKYNLNGGKNNKNNPTVYKANSGTIKLKSPTKKGYTFAGWYTDSKFKSRIKTIKGSNKKHYVLYAKWTSNKYSIVFDKNGGKGTMQTLSNCKYGKSYKLTANKFSRKGYTFVGWNTKPNGKGKTYKDKASVKNLTAKKNGTVKLYAIWKKN